MSEMLPVLLAGGVNQMTWVFQFYVEGPVHQDELLNLPQQCFLNGEHNGLVHPVLQTYPSGLSAELSTHPPSHFFCLW